MSDGLLWSVTHASGSSVPAPNNPTSSAANSRGKLEISFATAELFAYPQLYTNVHYSDGGDHAPPTPVHRHELLLRLRASSRTSPNLRGRPVAVIPTDAETTACIAASYEAKAFGVKTGTPVWEARKLCPGIVCVVADHKRYVVMHNRVAGRPSAPSSRSIVSCPSTRCHVG